MTLKALIVDDDESIRHVMRCMLEDHPSKISWRINDVKNGEEAVHIIRACLKNQERYDLICMDIDMPLKNGIEALKEIRQLEIEHKIEDRDKQVVIMMSALVTPERTAACFKWGCATLIQKSFGSEKFYEEVERAGICSYSRKIDR